ncbi:MAG: hypothetical protein E7617_05980 [Ruminococcaceae bacterium]|nr:hypothetical protein [Oscillospiraceae bacterium]
MQFNKFKIKKPIHKSLSYLLDTVPIFFWISIVLAFELPYVAVLSLISAVIHEAGHICAAYHICGGSVLRSGFFGMRLYTKRSMSYKDEIIIAAAGPMANAVTALLLLPFASMGGAYISDFFLLNIGTAISNLLPIEGYDGYRITENALLLFRKDISCSSKLGYVSLFLNVAVCFLTLYLMVKVDGGYWIYLVFIVSMVKGIKKCSHSFL